MRLQIGMYRYKLTVYDPTVLPSVILNDADDSLSEAYTFGLRFILWQCPSISSISTDDDCAHSAYDKFICIGRSQSTARLYFPKTESGNRSGNTQCYIYSIPAASVNLSRGQL
eukprot:IDg10078t1